MRNDHITWPPVPRDPHPEHNAEATFDEAMNNVLNHTDTSHHGWTLHPTKGEANE